MSGVPPRLAEALVDRYRLEGELGAGGMATVYLAQDVKHRRRVAIKVLRPELAAVIGAERFLAEIRTTANLQHPNILPLFDSGEAEGFLYYVMPYVEGETLRDRLNREKQLPVEEAVGIVREVADALAHAHRQGIVHRDVKPANILLQEGRALVADFGIAVAVSAAGEGRLTETGLSLGTPHYMSPEQASAEPDLTPRSDVYSLGAVLYETLAGLPPHAGPTAQSVLVKILTEEPVSLTAARRTVPPHVAATVRRAMEKLPADRFATAEEFREKLGDPSFRYEPAELGAGSRPGAGTSEAGGPGPRGVLTPVLAAVTGLAVGAAAVGWLLSPEAPDARPVTLKLEVASGAPGSMNFDVAEDGSAFVVAVPGSGLSVRSADDPVFVHLPGTEGAVIPDFSPDGGRIAFSRGGAILEVSARGGEIRTLIPRPASGALVQAKWGADGSLVVGGPGGMLLLEPGAVEPRDLDDEFRPLIGDFRTPSLLPDGSGILFARMQQGNQADLMLLDLQGDSLVDLGFDGWRPQYAEPGHVLYVDDAGVLYGLPFDVRTRTVTGPRVRVMDGVSRGLQSAGFTVSAEGTLLVERGGATAGGDVVLTEYEVATGETIGDLPVGIGAYEDGAYSPDGRRVVLEVVGMSGVPNIHVLDLERSNLSQLTFEGDNHQPVWAPDGRSVVFTSQREGTLQEDLWTKPADGGGAARSLLSRDGALHVEAWTPDSLMIVFWAASGGDGTQAHEVIRPGADEPSRPLDLGFSLGVPMRVAPDGRWLAYEAPTESGYDVFVRRFPRGEGQWRITRDGGSDPRWAPDSGTLYYITSEGLMAAELQYEPTPLVTGTRRVAEALSTYIPYTFWDVHPSGDRFLVGRVTSGLNQGGDLWVTLDWPALLAGSEAR